MVMLCNPLQSPNPHNFLKYCIHLVNSKLPVCFKYWFSRSIVLDDLAQKSINADMNW